MKIAELAERIVRAVSGGKATNEGSIDYAYIESMLPKWRRRAISIVYNGDRETAGNKMVAPDWMQSVTLTIPASQRLSTNQNIYTECECPAPLRLNVEGDGFIFFGDAQDTVGFTRIQSMSYAADLVRRGDLNKDEIGYVLVGKKARFYGNKQLENVTIEGILDNPLDDPNFDIDNDEYPVDEDTIEVMERIAFRELAPIMGVPEDLINDGVDTKDRRINKTNAV